MDINVFDARRGEYGEDELKVFLNLQSALRVLTQKPKKVSEFMNLDTKVVARFEWLSTCTNIGRVRMIQSPMGMCMITFSSDYSPSALESNGWTQSESSMTQSSYDGSMTVSVSSIVAHGAEVGSSRAPHYDGAYRSL
jgi:hypothetical protein